MLLLPRRSRRGLALTGGTGRNEKRPVGAFSSTSTRTKKVDKKRSIALLKQNTTSKNFPLPSPSPPKHPSLFHTQNPRSTPHARKNHGAPLPQEPHLQAGLRGALRGHVCRRKQGRRRPVPAAVPRRGRPERGERRGFERGLRRRQRRALRRPAGPEPGRALLCLPGAERRVCSVVGCGRRSGSW